MGINLLFDSIITIIVPHENIFSKNIVMQQSTAK